MRQIILDTETTGIGAENGHKIIEIGCVELVNRKITGERFHVYLNPEREVDEGAFRVHGISTEFLQDKPLFKDIQESFLTFISGSELIIHNAPFDIGFLNVELKKVKSKIRIEEYCKVIDTLVLARDKHPGQKNSLDALCKRYQIDTFNRDLHGALLDAEILAHVYLAMTGGQGTLFDDDVSHKQTARDKRQSIEKLQVNNAVILSASPEDLKEHQEFVAFLEKKSGKNYWV